MSDQYVPTIPRHPDPPATSPGGGSVETGAGAPTGTANSGDLYVDVSTGDVYVFVNGAWQILISGAGGNKVTVQTTDASGSGSMTGDLWINKSTNGLWVWTGSAWQQVITP